ncbi:SagB/ThcOx family dehydrogenase [Patescibacteria group bacterium]|nr:SagB/ThcOx family dehydrogenase [Patescibacteria group bacterium]
MKREKISQVEPPTGSIKLSEPKLKSDLSIEEAILKRRSIRDYKDEAISLSDISQLLWAAQGVTDKEKGGRSAPSAGALYPLEIYLLAGKVEELGEGLYKYNPENHQLIKTLSGDKRTELTEAAVGQTTIKNAPAIIIITGVYERTRAKYGERAERYVHLEAGHASQNIYLQSESLGLGTVSVGAFDDERVKQALGLSNNETPLYLMPVGKK